MRVLLDECMPRQLRRDLAGHDVQTVHELGLAGLHNGALLREAVTAGIQIFLTVDRGIEFQHDIPSIRIAIVELRARSNDVDDLRPLMPAVLEVLDRAPIGRVTRIP